MVWAHGKNGCAPNGQLGVDGRSKQRSGMR